MNTNKLDSIIIDYIRDKMCMAILNNIYEIKKIFEYSCDNIFNDNIKKIQDKCPSYVYDIKNIISKNFDDRLSHINNLEKDIESVEKLTLPILATLNFADLIKSIAYDYYNEKFNNPNDTDFTLNYNKILDIIYMLLEEQTKDNSLIESGGLFLSLINCNMTKDNYNNYVYNSLNLLYNNQEENTIENSIELLKFKFAPFKYIENNEDTKILLDIFKTDYKNLTEEELSNILKTLDNIQLKYSNKIGDMIALYDFLKDTLCIYKFTPDLNYIFKDDFILKDIYYYTCELIENKDFSMFENIETNLEEKVDILIESLEKNEHIIKDKLNKNNDYTDAIKTFLTLNKYSNLNLEERVLFKINNNNSIANKQFINNKINELLNFINTLDVTNVTLKKLKQEFFFHIPCYLDLQSLKTHFKNSLENLDNQALFLIFSKFMSIYDSSFSNNINNWEDYTCTNPCCNHNH